MTISDSSNSPDSQSDLHEELAKLKAELQAAREREAKLLQELNYHRALVRHFPNGAIHLLDSELRYRLAGGEMFDRHGIDPENIHGRLMWDFVEPGRQEALQAHYQAALGGVPQHFDFEAQERILDTYIMPVQNADQEVTGLLVIVLDATKERHDQEELARYQVMLSQSQSLAHVGCYEWDLRSDECIWSRETYRLMQLNPETTPAGPDTYMDYVHPEDKEKIQQVVADNRALKHPYNGQHRMILPDGNVHIHRSTSIFLRDNDGTPIKVLGTIIDITDQLESEAARHAAEEKLRQERVKRARHDRLRALGEMSAGISHELNQPLQGIRGLSEHLLLNLKRGQPTTDAQLEHRLRSIMEQADRMTHIIRHVREFAGHASTPKLTELNINKVVRASLELMERDLESRNMRLAYDLAYDIPKILSNRYSLEEVLINLLVNARDAVEDLPADQRTTTTDLILVRTFMRSIKGTYKVCCQIIDRGTGMTLDVQDKAFEPFFTTKSPGRGTGIGLPICLSIMRQLGADLDIVSKPGTGTTVQLSFTPLDLDPNWSDQTWLFETNEC